MHICPHCKEVVDRVALIMLVYTWEPVNVEGSELQELQEFAWHKECFVEDYLAKQKESEVE